MFVSIYYKPSLFNAHTMILIVHIFMNVNKLCLNQEEEEAEEGINFVSFLAGPEKGHVTGKGHGSRSTWTAARRSTLSV